MNRCTCTCIGHVDPPGTSWWVCIHKRKTQHPLLRLTHWPQLLLVARHCWQEKVEQCERRQLCFFLFLQSIMFTQNLPITLSRTTTTTTITITVSLNWNVYTSHASDPSVSENAMHFSEHPPHWTLRAAFHQTLCAAFCWASNALKSARSIPLNMKRCLLLGIKRIPFNLVRCALLSFQRIGLCALHSIKCCEVRFVEHPTHWAVRAALH